MRVKQYEAMNCFAWIIDNQTLNWQHRIQFSTVLILTEGYRVKLNGEYKLISCIPLKLKSIESLNFDSEYLDFVNCSKMKPKIKFKLCDSSLNLKARK